MKVEPKGPPASRLRQRKFELIRRFHIPGDLLPGSLCLSQLRCGKPTCHCARGSGHPVWSLTFMVKGKKHVQHIPKDWVEDVRQRVEAGRQFQDALREHAYHAVESLVRSSARRALGVSRSFGDDALGYFTERLNPAVTRAALATTL